MWEKQPVTICWCWRTCCDIIISVPKPLLHDRFTCGLTDEQIQSTLLNTQDLKFKWAGTITTLIEMVLKKPKDFDWHITLVLVQSVDRTNCKDWNSGIKSETCKYIGAENKKCVNSCYWSQKHLSTITFLLATEIPVVPVSPLSARSDGLLLF